MLRIYSSFLRFCASRFLFLRKKPKNKKIEYKTILIRIIKRKFEVCINNFYKLNLSYFYT